MTSLVMTSSPVCDVTRSGNIWREGDHDFVTHVTMHLPMSCRYVCLWRYVFVVFIKVRDFKVQRISTNKKTTKLAKVTIQLYVYSESLVGRERKIIIIMVDSSILLCQILSNYGLDYSNRSTISLH